MPIAIQIPFALRVDCGGKSELELADAHTVRAALELLEEQHPAIYRSVCHENGQVRPHINLFVNSALIVRDTGLDSKLQSGDRLTIMPAVSGG